MRRRHGTRTCGTWRAEYGSRRSLTQAVVVDPEAPGHLAVREVEEPVPGPSESLIRVAAFSLNRGEIRRTMTARAGSRPGWDLAGTVEVPASDGNGPPEGTRVVGQLEAAAWAQLAAVPTHALAAISEAVPFSQAAALPVAGLTALLMLDRRGSLIERTVLVTGASGGVGVFAVQLARLGGARVIAQVRREERGRVVSDLGADEVVVTEDGAALRENGPYDLVLDSTGGPILASALEGLARGGVCVTYGHTGYEDLPMDLRAFIRVGSAMSAFQIFHELGREPAGVGLARLVRLVADGRLKPHIEVEASWHETGAVAQRLNDRDFVGKAVLHVA